MTEEVKSAAARVQDAFMGALLGILLTVMGAYFAYPRDLATKEDIAALESQFQKQYDRQDDQLQDVEKRVNDLETGEGIINERLNLRKQP